MKVVSIACNHCGAPLDVPLNTKFVTCKFCESRLEVQQSDSAYFTSVLEVVNEIKEDVATLKVRSELEQLDREWQQERESLLVVNEGRASEPTRLHAIGPAVAGIFFFVVFTQVGDFASGSGFDSLFPLFFLFAILGCVGGVVHFLWKSQRYAERKAAYEARRREVMRKLKS